MFFSRRIPHARSLAAGLVCAALALAWQALTVRYNYGGNWTGLFCTGANQRIPGELAAERIYVLPNSDGFDGQFYHYLAHDPLLRSGLTRYIDAPRLRCRRILVPALAFLLAGGRQRHIDGAYLAAVLLFVFLGGYWLSRFAVLHGRHFGWGILFLTLPGVLTSIDRMTIDVALAAFWAGFAVYAARSDSRGVYWVLALAALTRETGIVLAATYCLYMLWQRQIVKASWAGLTLLPSLAWYLYVFLTLPPDTNGWAVLRVGGLLAAVLNPFPYPWSAPYNAFVIAVDYLALAGILLAVFLALREVIRRSRGILEFAVAVQGVLGLVFVVFGSRDTWVHIYGYARLLSPVVELLALRSLSRKSRADLLPFPMVLPRFALQWGGQALAIARGLAAPFTGGS